MSRAEKFIQDYTRNCSNELQCYDGDCNPQIIYNSWLTPDQARRAVEIAKEEIYEWLRINLCNYFDAPRSMFDMCLEDLKKQ
jgi:hypothetical protein